MRGWARATVVLLFIAVMVVLLVVVATVYGSAPVDVSTAQVIVFPQYPKYTVMCFLEPDGLEIEAFDAVISAVTVQQGSNYTTYSPYEAAGYAVVKWRGGMASWMHVQLPESPRRDRVRVTVSLNGYSGVAELTCPGTVVVQDVPPLMMQPVYGLAYEALLPLLGHDSYWEGFVATVDYVGGTGSPPDRIARIVSRLPYIVHDGVRDPMTTLLFGGVCRDYAVMAASYLSLKGYQAMVLELGMKDGGGHAVAAYIDGGRVFAVDQLPYPVPLKDYLGVIGARILRAYLLYSDGRSVTGVVQVPGEYVYTLLGSTANP